MADVTRRPPRPGVIGSVNARTISMLLEGPQLGEMIRQTGTDIELRNEYGRICRILSSVEAIALDLDLFIGVGNRRRLRFLRPRSGRIVFNAGSRTAQRLTGEAGIYIAHPAIREHRTMR
jgi:hypothetical protein